MQSAYHHLDVIGDRRNSLDRKHKPLREVSVMQRSGEVVYLVDDDYRVHETLSAFLTDRRIEVRCFTSARQYLEDSRRDETSCLVLDLNLPDVNGLELQRQLAGKAAPPIIFISKQPDVQSSVLAIKAGAIEFLMKPVDPDRLLLSVHAAFALDKALRKRQATFDGLHKRFSRLTPREREVLPLVVGGFLNKQAAFILGISEVTLQIHRSNVIRKMEANSLAELVRMAVTLRIPFGHESWRGTSITESSAMDMRNDSRSLTS